MISNAYSKICAAIEIEQVQMSITLRRGVAKDAEQCARFATMRSKPLRNSTTSPLTSLLQKLPSMYYPAYSNTPTIYGVVAELDGRIVGSNFIDERSIIAGIGPITVEPEVQNRSVGRELMQHVMARAAQQRFPGYRLVQAAYHNRSLSLYAKLGFVAREPLSAMQGPRLAVQIPGYSVRPATTSDLGACNQVCMKVHGHDREGELIDSIKQGKDRKSVV